MYPRSMFYVKIRKNIAIFFHLKIMILTAVENCSISHGRVFVMIEQVIGITDDKSVN